MQKQDHDPALLLVLVLAVAVIELMLTSRT